MSYLQPNVNKGIVDANGKMLEGLRRWVQNVTRTQLFRGTGSPEGVLEAIEDAQYVDTASDVLYYKKYSDILGDTSKGWAGGGGYSAQTGDYTLTDADFLVNFTASGFTATLPTAVGVQGKRYIIKNSSAGLLTVVCNGSETIDGSATQILSSYDSMQLMSDGANWMII